MAVEVYFAKDETFPRSIVYFKKGGDYGPAEARAALFGGGYEKVAEFPEGTSLGAIFHQTQNLDEAWCEPPKRSMSVGDIIKRGDEFYIVAMLGFDKL